MARSVDEWIGKNDDAKIPARVRLRIFEAHHGRCYLSGILIRAGDKWECEHIRPLSLGGEHRESNLAPALVEPHKEKTKKDRAIKKKADRTKKKHIGIKKKSRFPGSKDSPWKAKIGGGWERR